MATCRCEPRHLVLRSLTLLLAHEPRRRARRRDRGRRARGRAAGRRLGARQPARSRAPAARPHRSCVVLRRDSFARRSADDLAADESSRRVRRHRAADCRSRASSAIRPAAAARRACRSTASTIASGAFTASPACAGPTGARRCSAAALAARHRRRAGQHACWCASSGRRRFRSNRCTAARTISGRTLRLTVRAIVGRGAAGRVLAAGRSRATCAPCSCRSRGCSRISTSPAA